MRAAARILARFAATFARPLAAKTTKFLGPSAPKPAVLAANEAKWVAVVAARAPAAKRYVELSGGQARGARPIRRRARQFGPATGRKTVTLRSTSFLQSEGLTNGRLRSGT